MTSLQVSRQEAANELLRRREAREHLIAYTRYTMPGFEDAEHHHEIAQALESVVRGECKRLMIFAPPRHTKSELASRRFPAFFLGRNPDKQIIASTYSHDFAADFGREVRAIIQSEEHQNLFDVGIRSDSKSANRWHTTENGVYVSTGVSGPITGRGAHLALIDDPFKNREEADSEKNRRRVWNWYTSTLRPRLMPGGAIVIIMTRWHESDLAGMLLEAEKQGGEKWQVISLQAISNEGTKKEKALWPAWYDLHELKSIRQAIGIRDWQALYQQQPKPIEGTLIKRDWFARFYPDELPQLLNVYITSDFATDPETQDFTELAVWGLDDQNQIWMIDWWHGQETADVWIDKLLDMATENRPLCFFGEAGVIRRAIEPFLKKRMQKRRVFFRVEWITRVNNKVLSLRGFQALASQRQVHIPHGEKGDRVINQLCEFPAAKNDDAVDACSLLGMAMDQQHEAIAAPAKPQPKRDTWGRQKRANSWRV